MTPDDQDRRRPASRRSGPGGKPVRIVAEPSAFLPKARNVLMNGFDPGAAQVAPEVAERIGLVQRPMLMIISPPQTRARMLMIVPQLPRLNQALLVRPAPPSGHEDAEVAQEVADVDHPGRGDRQVDAPSGPVTRNGIAAEDADGDGRVGRRLERAG